MTRDTATNLRLSSKNLHLKSIFSADAYLELGNLDYQVLEKLLNYEMININDIVDFSIQNMGIGRMNIQNKDLSNKMPYLFFKNIVDKDKLKQLIISYGILTYTNNDNKEVFMPIVLIPVDLFVVSENIYFQLVNSPIENPLLLSTLTEVTKSSILWGNKLDSVYAIDQFCMSFANNEGFSIRLENYLTYGNIRKKDVLIDFSKLERNKEIENKLSDKLYSADLADCYYSLPLNKTQREILINAVLGKSFSIVGRLGTGKTTVLKDVMINAVNQGKRVLFISDMIETLTDILDYMKQINMENYVADLSIPFTNLLTNTVDIISRNYSSPKELKDDLFERYQKLNEYETAMNGRIANFQYLEVVDELLKFRDPSTEKIEIDKLEDLYKHEYFTIKTSLEKIQGALLKMDNFKESIWKEIPVLNNVKYPNQIITLIYQINRCFRTFLEEKNYFETNFGIKKIENYAMLKNVLYHLENLDIALVPKSWVEESLKGFKEAQIEYKNLKNEINKIQEINNYCNQRYTNLDSINIEDEIAVVFQKYFKQNDFSSIDSLNANRKKVTIKINKGAIQKEIFLKTLEKIFAFSDWEFWAIDEGLEEIIKFINYVSTHKINRKLVNIVVNNQQDSFTNKLNKVTVEIDELITIVNNFRGKYPKLTIKESLIILKNIKEIKKIDSNVAKNKALNSIRKKYNKVKIDDFVLEMEQNIAASHRLKVLKEQYFNLTKVKYDANNDLLGELDTLKEYFSNITRYEYRGIITKMFYRLTDKEVMATEEYDKLLKTLLMYKKAYLELFDLIEDLSRYDLMIQGNNTYEKILNLDNIFKYIQDLYSSNDRMLSVIRASEQDYIKAETYLDIRDMLREKNKKINDLKDNEKYKRLFGVLYNNEKTVVSSISKIMQNFEAYVDCFKNLSFFVNSFHPKRHALLITHITTCKEIGNALIETFKMYCKIFKDGISRYYYNDFEETLEYTTKLLNSKDELLNYLTITEGLGVLNKYKLGKLIKYIITTKRKDKIVADFCSIYLNELNNRYLANHQILSEIRDINIYLQEINQLETSIIAQESKNVLNDIRKFSFHRVNLSGLKHLDYQNYIRRTKGVKHIFLGSTKLIEKYINVDDFDLIIVDDAHIPSSNLQFLSQTKAQLIISGEYQLHESISNNLISIIKNTQKFYLDYRYSLTPKGLIHFMKGQRGLFPNTYSANMGLMIIEKNINDYILELLVNDENVKINYFIKNLGKQQSTYQEISKMLNKKNYNFIQINHFFINNINICDLANGYLIDADYNIIDYEDYYMVDIDYIYDNMLDNLLLCKKKVIIYDKNKILQEEQDFKFAAGLKDILDGYDQIFSENFSDTSKELLAQEIKNYGYQVYVNNDNVNLILEKDDILYGVLILFDEINRIEIMNIYRDKYYANVENGWKIVVIEKTTLIKGLDYTAKKIVEAISND